MRIHVANRAPGQTGTVLAPAAPSRRVPVFHTKTGEESRKSGGQARGHHFAQMSIHPPGTSLNAGPIQQAPMKRAALAAVTKWVSDKWPDDKEGLSAVIDWFKAATISDDDVQQITKAHDLDKWWDWAQTINPKEVDP